MKTNRNFILAITLFLTSGFVLIDNDYKSVTIISQTWMAENLNVDKFRNGEPIFEAKNKEEWVKANNKKKPAFCYYNYDKTNGVDYGKYYNWYAVNDKRGLAPRGWRIPSENDFKDLLAFLGGENKQTAVKLQSKKGWNNVKTFDVRICASHKEWRNNGGFVYNAAEKLWNIKKEEGEFCERCGYPLTKNIIDEFPASGTDEYGFNAQPSDLITVDGYAGLRMGDLSVFWTSTDDSRQTDGEQGSYYFEGAKCVMFPKVDIYKKTGKYDYNILGSLEKGCGLSIRCIKE